MKRARVWARVADDIRPLREPSTIGKALTEEDKQRLLKTAVMRPEWETAYLADSHGSARREHQSGGL